MSVGTPHSPLPPPPARMKWHICCAVRRYISYAKFSLKSFGTSIDSLDPETVQLSGIIHRHICRSVWPATRNLSLDIHGAILLDILFTYTQYSLFLTEVGYSLFLKLKSKTLSIHFFAYFNEVSFNVPDRLQRQHGTQCYSIPS